METETGYKHNYKYKNTHFEFLHTCAVILCAHSWYVLQRSGLKMARSTSSLVPSLGRDCVKKWKEQRDQCLFIQHREKTKKLSESKLNCRHGTKSQHPQEEVLIVACSGWCSTGRTATVGSFSGSVVRLEKMHDDQAGPWRESYHGAYEVVEFDMTEDGNGSEVVWYDTTVKEIAL